MCGHATASASVEKWTVTARTHARERLAQWPTFWRCADDQRRLQGVTSGEPHATEVYGNAGRLWVYDYGSENVGRSGGHDADLISRAATVRTVVQGCA